jgi:hypothetical protein
MIDFYSVVTFLYRVKLSKLAITHEINRMLGYNTISYSTVEKYIHVFISGSKQTDSLFTPESSEDFTFDDCITRVLSDELFLSIHQIVKKVIMLKSIVYQHLTGNMRWRLKHLK